MLAADVKPTPIPVTVKPIDTEERDRERARAIATANVNKDYIQTLYPSETVGKQNAPENKTKELTGLEALQAEILQDIRARKEEAKKTRESNNLMALMQAGFATAASKNIHPLGAIAEGGQQGIGTLAALRKQEAEEAKDIGAQQIGLYRFGSTAEQAKALQELRATQNDLRKTPEERARDMAETDYTRQVAAIDRRQAEYEKQYGLDPVIQEQFDAQRRALRKQIYEHFKVPTITEFKLPPIVPPKPKEEPSLWDRITGRDNQGTPPLPPGYKLQ
jgi:hypothetical protein